MEEEEDQSPIRDAGGGSFDFLHVVRAEAFL
jgi:hypothetical protein